MFIPLNLLYPLLGIISFLLALYTALVAPPGRRGGFAIGGALLVALLCVFAAFALWPIDPKNEWNWLPPGLVLAMILIVVRDMRRWSRYFRDNTYRRYHPYNWYGRIRRRRYYR